FFFFQAEDGIRDFHVTGVQTCALPISRAARCRRWPARRAEQHEHGRRRIAAPQTGVPMPNAVAEPRPLESGTLRIIPTGGLGERSAERRVGKEGVHRWGGRTSTEERC